MTNNKQLPLFEFETENTSKVNDQSKESIESPYSKYIVYVDESGDHGLRNIDNNYPVFVLAFCIFHKRHYSEMVVPSVEKFKFNHFGHDQVVLHEREIRKEKGAFNFFKNKKEKQDFMFELSEIIEKSNFILVSCTIDKKRLVKNAEFENNPYHTALAICMEALHEFLTEKGQETKKTHVVVECRGPKEDGELELEFRRVCDGQNRFGIQMPFEVLFKDKKAMSTGLQLADLVARPIGLKTIRPQQVNRAFEVLENKFYCKGGREELGDNYEGIGMNFYPPLKSEKPQ